MLAMSQIVTSLAPPARGGSTPRCILEAFGCWCRPSELDGPAVVVAGELLADRVSPAGRRRDDAHRKPEPAPLARVRRQEARGYRECVLVQQEAGPTLLDAVDKENSFARVGGLAFCRRLSHRVLTSCRRAPR